MKKLLLMVAAFALAAAWHSKPQEREARTRMSSA